MRKYLSTETSKKYHQIANKNMNNTTIATQENSRTKDEVDSKDFITAASIMKTKFQALYAFT
jgi:hypothetical protein